MRIMPICARNPNTVAQPNRWPDFAKAKHAAKAYLILASFSSVRTFHIHDHDVHIIAPAHPYPCSD